MSTTTAVKRVSAKQCTCLRCEHTWVSRKLVGLPDSCPKCFSPYWNKPRKTESQNPISVYKRARRQGDEELAKQALEAIRAMRAAAKQAK